MTLHTGPISHRPDSIETIFPDAFRPWRAQLMRDGALPLIAVAGSRGKSTVCDLLASIFDQA
jgi:UDP-N-acetylmuramyl pentapeptide synthase